MSTWMKVWSGALTVATIVLSINAQASESITSFRSDSGTTYIDITGEIKSGDDVKFRRFLTQVPSSDLVVVRLASLGGDLVAGLNIGEQIHTYNSRDDQIALTRESNLCLGMRFDLACW